MKIWLSLPILALTLTSTPAAAQANPNAAETQAARNRGPCSDPWVTLALESVYGRVPDRRHCAIGLYANGSWNSYSQLVGEVRLHRYTFGAVKIGGTGPLAGKFALGIFSRGSLVAAGGENLVAAGAGNLVGNDGASMVAAGAGNIVQDGNALFSPGNDRSLMSKMRVRVIN